MIDDDEISFLTAIDLIINWNLIRYQLLNRLFPKAVKSQKKRS